MCYVKRSEANSFLILTNFVLSEAKFTKGKFGDNPNFRGCLCDNCTPNFLPLLIFD